MFTEVKAENIRNVAVDLVFDEDKLVAVRYRYLNSRKEKKDDRVKMRITV